jgi:anti-sigma regulatory factor (Ser/Thr protein kinase)
MTDANSPPTEYHPSPGIPRLTTIPLSIPPSHPQPPAGGEWPLCSHMTYGALLDTVPTARTRTHAVLREWGVTPSDLIEDVLVVVSELVSNAVVASRALPETPPVRVWVCCDWARVLVEVGDENPARPVRTSPNEDALSGRGLVVIEALSSSWGWFSATHHGLAKVVWADLHIPSTPPPTTHPGSIPHGWGT